MSDRYARVDVAFFHKRTCDRLYEQFGYAGPLVFLALICQVKVSNVPGVFIYENEAIGWAKLGFEGRLPEFTLDEFFALTGRLKQTSRTRVGRVSHVKLTQYERWQKDSQTYEARVRKSRSRQENTSDIGVTDVGQARDTAVTKSVSSSRTITTPQTPQSQNGKHPHDCPVCGTRQPSRSALDAHLERSHPTAAVLDDIPF